MSQSLLKQTLLDGAQIGGQVLMAHFGRIQDYQVKEHQSSIVTAADLASECEILALLRKRFPNHGIIAEEAGYIPGTADFTWVVDPLDGTSNFAAGLPWFGVLLAVLQQQRPIMATMFIPCLNLLYFSQLGQGVFCNEQAVGVSQVQELKNILCAFGFDGAVSAAELRQQAELLCRLASRVRNFRSTNCLLDMCFTVDGRLGACLNLNTKIWDIAPLGLMLPEAGGRLTDLNGNSIEFSLDRESFDRNYTILGANPVLHAQLLELISAS